MAKFSIPTLAARRDVGRAVREKVPRAEIAKWKVHAGRDVTREIREANAGRLPKLIPIKMGRMYASPFSFFRGTAGLMAADLARGPETGLNVQLCGDAHVKNLGAYAAPEGHLVFDINDFDETIPGRWEWDLKRLITSVVLAGREVGVADKICAEAVTSLVQCYEESLDMFSQMKAIELARYEIRRQSENRVINGVLQKAARVTPEKTLKKLTVGAGDACPKFHDELPVLRHVPDGTRRAVFNALKDYRETVTAGRQLILDAYHPVDIAFKIVGTGSVGTRDYVVLLFGKGYDDPMFLQLKEELHSCYEPYVRPRRRFRHEGQRVAQGQQRMQTVVDPFLGWVTIDGRPYLVRQLSDHKAGIDPLELKGEALMEYALVCGKVFAKAHARTGNGCALHGYCGGSGKLGKVMSKFAVSYADQVTSDYEQFLRAVKNHKIKIEVPK